MQPLTVYDKPMIDYPLTTLMLAGIRDLLIIPTPPDQPLFRRILGDELPVGHPPLVRREVASRRLAQAFIIGRDFVDNDPSWLVIGDNIFYGHGLTESLRRASARTDCAPCSRTALMTRSGTASSNSTN